MPSEPTLCALCETDLTGLDTWETEGSVLCGECYEEQTFACEHCGTERICSDDDLHINGGIVCPGCAENYACCDSCEAYVHCDETHIVGSDSVYCENCYTEYAFTCDGCNDSYASDSYIRIGDGLYCEDCASDRAEQVLENISDCSNEDCEDCNSEFDSIRDVICSMSVFDSPRLPVRCISCRETIYSIPARPRVEVVSMILRGDGLKCEYCLQNAAGARRLHNYSFKPDPLFRKTIIDLDERALHFGTEVEVELVRSDRVEALKILGELDEGELFYCKSDSTIDNGFEVVSHPFTYNWMVQNKKAFDALFKLGSVMEGWSATNCGMHIHMSSDAFTNMHLFKFMRFFGLNREFIGRLSRREREDLDKWAPIDSHAKKKLMRFALKREGSPFGRAALNFGTREPTIECRIFRSTLAPAVYYGNVEFLQSLYDFTKGCGATDNELSLDRYMDYVHNRSKAYPNFILMTNIIEPEFEDEFDWGVG